MNDSATTQKPTRREFLSSAGTERTAFALFCGIAVFALLLTTVLGTDPAPEATIEDSTDMLVEGIIVREPRATEEPQPAVVGYRGSSPDQ